MRIVAEVPPCPRCLSERTGIIKAKTRISLKKEVKDMKKEVLNGHLVRYVPADMWGNYYKKFGINCFCSECGYEFQGKLKKDSINLSDVFEYKKSHGIDTAEKGLKRKLFHF